MKNLFYRYQPNLLALLGLLVLSIVLLRYFFQPGIMQTHDGEMHLARLANYGLALRDGQIPVRWAPNLNYKFGYPIFNYTYPAIYILSLTPVVLGFTFETSLKITLFLLFWLSGVGMYFLVKTFTSRSAGLVSGVLLLTAPYYFTLIYLRGSIGENLAIALTPWVAHFGFKLSRQPTRVYFAVFTITAWLFLLSHNILVMLITPILLFCLLLAKYFNIINQYKNTLLGLFIASSGSLFFWLPALLEKKLVNLEAYDSTQLLNHFVYLNQFIKPIWQYGYSVAGSSDKMSFFVGWGSIIVLALAVYSLIDKYQQEKQSSSGILLALVFSLTALFMMTAYSRPIWQNLPLIGYSQFPWRFQGIFILTTSVLTGLVVYHKPVWLKLALIVLALITVWPQTTPLKWGTQPDWFYLEYPFTASTKNEMTPRGFDITKFLEYKDQARGALTPITITQQLLKSHYHAYQIFTEKSNQFIDHTAYFPGWRASINHQPVDINPNYPDYKGLITIPVPAGKSQVIIKLGQTPARSLGNYLSLVSLGLFIGALIVWPKLNKLNHAKK